LISKINLPFVQQVPQQQHSSASSIIITGLLETQPLVRVIALDFSKAFDTVRHAQLMHKLGKLSIPSKINGWVANFLSSRSHTTIFEGHTSPLSHINASVVQGSALGPPAFVIVHLRLKDHALF
jgi:hypothetical protein